MLAEVLLLPRGWDGTGSAGDPQGRGSLIPRSLYSRSGSAARVQKLHIQRCVSQGQSRALAWQSPASSGHCFHRPKNVLPCRCAAGPRCANTAPFANETFHKRARYYCHLLLVGMGNIWANVFINLTKLITVASQLDL